MAGMLSMSVSSVQLVVDEQYCSPFDENWLMTDETVIAPGTYRHYKGNLYEVIGLATHSETEESLVVYRALYGEYGIWVRPLKMFRGIVDVDGHSVRRFAPVDA